MPAAPTLNDLSDPAAADPLAPTDLFPPRHIGPSEADVAAMLEVVGEASLDELIEQVVPGELRLDSPLVLEGAEAQGEAAALAKLREVASGNRVLRSMIGQGYHGTITPSVIRRTILENPLWYTPYTPYQAEISQGRLEALLNFQTMVSDLTGLPLAGASLLDEGTAAAEAMAMCRAIGGDRRNVFIADAACHPQTLAVLATRARGLGVELRVEEVAGCELEATDAEGESNESSQLATRNSSTRNSAQRLAGVLVQYPTTDGRIEDYGELCGRVHAVGGLVVAAADPLALCMLQPPAAWGGGGADIAVGNTQRFGVPMGYGGPHAGYLATKEEYARKMPGRLVGLSRDAHGKPALRLAIQTREQHIKRDRATSNICTAQVLLAVIASMYAVYHGPAGLRRVAHRVHDAARAIDNGLRDLGYQQANGSYFDTLCIELPPERPADDLIDLAVGRGYNFRKLDERRVGITCDETTTRADVEAVLEIFAHAAGKASASPASRPASPASRAVPGPGSAGDGETGRGKTTDRARGRAGSLGLPRDLDAHPYLTHPVFHEHHQEHALLRYIATLQERDYSLADGMIPLGSCTMKLNAASEMLPITWPQFAAMHPFCPPEQAAGYRQLIGDLERWLGEITGLPAVSLQPNAGSQGEFAGLMAIRGYHEAEEVASCRVASCELEEGVVSSSSQLATSNSPTDNSFRRDVCLIPTSAHGTNPASAVVAGFRVVPVACRADGDIDLDDLRSKAEQHADRLGALMITYPSTHGVFERGVREACRIIHEHGGQVYLDGANMNAQVGLTSPAAVGADVCHLNLHKTFCIPHGGGGPGVGPVCAAEHLAPYLPTRAAGEGLTYDRIANDGNRESNDSSRSSPRHCVTASFQISAAPFGSPAILPIPWMYIQMMGERGLTDATRVAILNANYMARRLESSFDIVFRGSQESGGRVAHEFIIDCRAFQKSAGVSVEDIAKRLIDYGFHAPTMSWPVAGTMMIEPTESEPLGELDRFCDAMLSIREEITRIERGDWPRNDNPLHNAPHTAEHTSADEWSHAYPRSVAAYPTEYQRHRKYWPPVGRVDNPYGDRNLVCTCPPMSEYQSDRGQGIE